MNLKKKCDWLNCFGLNEKSPAKILSGGDYSIQSDIFAIGVVMEELQLDSKYDKIMQKCTARKPKDRYMSVQEIINDINHLMGE
ncbi:hypothetical protein Q7371_10325 [Glaesserella parasuis]|uniref:hypothetical protein n=1 Tax=Glaesserella parasuis TaxID=738 RepID=UPI001922CDBA|nr:hypothetical protein [Glaesserella parasuis]MDO9899042.1 hypothetical protein [Glaesserella parasuis]MDP0086690.1 hypothetical protein [Glaesserella parasuis]MDP0277975.1 hypothetical protein [Glaesserella parasuis]MDP0316381.1 hypothetical protein [Glaesserella parasuis]